MIRTSAAYSAAVAARRSGPRAGGGGNGAGFETETRRAGEPATADSSGGEADVAQARPQRLVAAIEQRLGDSADRGERAG